MTPQIKAEQLKELVARYYGLKVKKISVHKPHRLFFIEAEEQKFALKIFAQESRLQWQSSCLEQLAQRQTTGIVPFYTNVQGSPINKIEGETHVFGVLPFIPGKALHPTHYSHLRHCSSLLGHFHSKAQYFQARNKKLDRSNINRSEWLERLQQRLLMFSASLQTLKKQGGNKQEGGLLSFLSRFEDDVKEWAQWVVRYTPQAQLSQLEQEAQAKGQLVHLDVAAHNFMVTEENSYYILDYDLMQISPALMDVTQYIHRALLHYDWETDVVEELLLAYQQERQLSALERLLLPYLLVYPHDVFREWLGIWKNQVGYQVKGTIDLFQRLDQAWARRRKFVRACQAMVK